MLLVVAANTGVSTMTREHLGLALALRLPLVVVVTKIDMAHAVALRRTVDQVSPAALCQPCVAYLVSKQLRLELSWLEDGARMLPSGVGKGGNKLFLLTKCRLRHCSRCLGVSACLCWSSLMMTSL